MIKVSVQISIVDLSNLPRVDFWREITRLKGYYNHSIDYLRYFNSQYQIIYGSIPSITVT